MIQIYRADRVEKEPLFLLTRLAVWGGLSTIAAGALENFFSFVYSSPSLSDLASLIIHYFLVVALIEEGVKYLVLKKITWNHPAFNYTFDAVVYSVCVSLGFALVENVMYAFLYGYRVTLIRAFTAIVLHAACGVFMGCYYGAAKKEAMQNRPSAAAAFRCKGFVTAVLVHGAYDTCATMNTVLSETIFFVLLAAIYIAAFRRIRIMQSTDAKI